MSRTIDERVVEMRFDNKQFESNAGQTMSTLEKLKNALNFGNASDSLDKLGRSVKNVDMNPLATAVEVVHEKFSALEVAAIGALLNITNKVVDAGTALIKELSVDQLTAGWDKYADKTSSVQTIMAATAKDFTDTGEQMEYVNAQLDKLNWFTDETSYNFLEMVNNIGKFTNNNIPLENAVTSMQGISTWAALAGANSEEASRAMYNLSQAISVGAVKLQDWKSIENANMATAEFKETAMQTAVELGYLSDSFEILKASDNYKGDSLVTIANFSQTLSSGWFSSEVLTATLAKYGAFTDELYNASEAMGDQYDTVNELLSALDEYKAGTLDITEIMENTGLTADEVTGYFDALADATMELGERGFRAAQEAKTFKEAIDATKDAVSTGWMNTFEIIFGDYEKAKVRWTNLANELYDVFASGAEARNELLTEALGVPKRVLNEGGWDDLAAKIEEAGIPVDDFVAKLVELGEEAGAIDGSTISGIDDFVESLKDGWLTADMVAEAIDSFIGPLNNVGGAVIATTESFDTFKDVITRTVRGEFGNGEERFNALAKAGWNAKVVQDAVNKTWDGTNKVLDLSKLEVEDYANAVLSLSDAEQAAVGYTEADIEALQALRDQYAGTGETLDDLAAGFVETRTGSELLFAGISQGWNAIKGIFSAMRQGWEVAFPALTADRLYDILAAFNSLATRFNEWVGNFDASEGDPLSQTVTNIKNTFAGLGSIVGIALDAAKAFVSFLRDTFGGAVGSGIDQVLSFTGNIGEFLVNLRGWLQANNVFRTGLERMYGAIQNGVDVVKGWFAAFQELPWVQEWTAKLSDAFGRFTDFITTNFPKATEVMRLFLFAFSDMWEKRDFTGIAGSIKMFASALKDDLIGVWDRLRQTKLFGKFAEGIEAVWNAIKNLDLTALPNWAKSVWDSVKTFLQPAIDFFIRIKDAIVNRAIEIGDGVLSVGSVLKAGVEYIREHIGGILAAFALFTTAAVVVKFIKTLVNIASLIAHPVEAITRAFNSFAGAARGVKNAFNALAIVEVVVAIGGLALMAAQLGKIPSGQLWSGVAAISVLGILVGVIIGLMARLTKNKSLLDPNQIKKSNNAMLQVLELAGSLFLVAMAFAKIVQTFQSDTGEGEIGKAIGFLVSGLVALSGVSFLLSKFGGTGGGAAIAGPVIAAAAALVAISYAFSELVDVLKDDDPNDIDQAMGILEKIGAGLGIFTVVMGLVAKIPTEGKASGVGVGLLASVISLKLLLSAFKQILNMDLTNFEEKIPLLIGVVISFGALMAALSLMPAKVGMNGVGLLAAAGAVEILAIAIRTMASMNAGDIAKGTLAIGALLIFMGIFTKLTAAGTNMTLKSSLIFITMSVSIGILAGVIALMSLLRPEDVLVGTAALSALMVTFGIMVALTSLAENLKVGTLLGLTAIMLALSGSVALIASLEDDAWKGVAVMGVMMTLFTIMSAVLSLVAKNFGVAGTGGLIAIVACALILAEMAGVVALLANMKNVDSAIAIAEALGVLGAGLGVAMLGFSSLSKISNLGTAFLAALEVIGILALVIAGIVALNELVPGAQTALNDALPLFRLIGDVIGQVIGGFFDGLFNLDVGGLGSKLTSFGDSMGSFAEAVSGIGNESAEGVKAIAAMLLALAGADLMNAITNLLGGKTTTLVEFSRQLPSFGANMASFSKNLGNDFNGKAISDAALAASDLTDLANNLPRSGGLAGSILGDKEGLDEFGKALPIFGAAISIFCRTIEGADFSPMGKAVNAAKKLVELQAALPKEDGWLTNFFGGGKTDLSEFGEQLVTFGTSLSKFSGSVTNAAELTSVIAQVSALVEMTKTLSGLDTTGMTGFSSALKTMAENGISDFCAAFENCTPQVQAAVNTFVNAAETAISSNDADFTAKGTTSATSYLDAIAAKNSAATTTGDTIAQKATNALNAALIAFRAKGLDSATNYLTGIQNKYPSAKSAGDSLSNNVLTQLTNKMSAFLNAGKNNASNYINGLQSYYGSATNAGNSLRNNAVNALSGYDASHTQGSNVAVGFINGMAGWYTYAYNTAYNLGRSAINGLQAAINAHSPSREAMKMGDYTGIGYVNALSNYTKDAYNAGGDVGDAALDGMNDATEKVSNPFDDDSVKNPVIRPVVELADVQDSVTTINDMFNHSIDMITDGINKAIQMISNGLDDVQNSVQIMNDMFSRSISMITDIASTTGATVETSRARTTDPAVPSNEKTGQSNNQTVNQYNTFNITSDDPEEVANRVSYILQRQVERREAVWG